MGKVTILGTSSAVPDENHENTHMVIQEAGRVILVDCVGSPVQRLKSARIDYDSISDIILTHFHPDHVSATPLLLMALWLMGRKAPINIYGLHDTLDRMKTMLDLFDWKNWPGFFPLAFFPMDEAESVLINDSFIKVTAIPVKHLVPTIGIRVDFKRSGKSMAYSCDTEPCPAVEQIANGVDVLIHEAAGNTVGHSSAGQAAEMAKKTGAQSLYLIHYPVGVETRVRLLEEARNTFDGPVSLAKDLQVIEF
ncbi:MAG: MBL fold metallo-hydrolase [Anaerolineae bacterium]|nr:MBL fold metallo-hydrolase [Anaerolineae bacterium]